METNKRIVKSPNICISLPVYSKADVPFFQSLLNCLSECGNIVGTVDFLPGDSLVNRARNNLVGRFLEGFAGKDAEGDCVVHYDWLLFIDTDLIFRPDAVRELYNMGKQMGVGVYCGIYPIKQLKPKIVFNNLPGQLPDEKGWVRVREAGTGFMLIHRNVFEQMREKYREEIEFVADTGDQSIKLGWDFFSVGVRLDKSLNRKRFLSEDWYFCQRWREMGGDVWLNTRIQCGHIGTLVYPGNPKDICAAADHYREAEKRMAEMQTQAIKVKTVKSPELVAATD